MYKPIKQNVAERLILARKELNLTIEEMGGIFGLSKGKFNSYLRGNSIPDDEILDRICEMANVDKFWMLYGDTKEFIENYLKSLGFERILEDDANLLDLLCFEFENEYKKIELISDGGFSEQLKKRSTLAKKIIMKHYEIKMKNYISLIVKDKIVEFQEYMKERIGEDFSDEWVVNKIYEEINKGLPRPKYGDKDEILKIADKKITIMMFGTTAYYQTDLNQSDVPDLLEITIMNLKSEENIRNLLQFMANDYGITVNTDSNQYSTIVEGFQRLSSELIDLAKGEEM